MHTTVLFVCRGNVFRSLIAETLLRSRQLPNVVVKSAGTVATQYREENSPIYKHMQEFLADHGLSEYMKDGYGEQLTQQLLDSADVVVLVNDRVREEAEAAGLSLPKQVLMWDVTDMGEGERVPKNKQEELAYEEEVFKEISQHVNDLTVLIS